MPVPIAVGILVGVAASFVQSLGLTLQRLSHLSNEQRADRQPDWQRPLWLVGLAIFLTSNVTGTLFQISTLPLVVLGPLGAVSLVCNALFAHLLLGDAFSLQLAVGSVLIAAGATLVGIFGAVPEQSHTLPQLVALYRRPPFLAWLALLAVALALVLTASHVAQWRLAHKLATLPAVPKSQRSSSANRRRRPRARPQKRRWSLPTSSLRKPSGTIAGQESSGGEREPLLGPRAHQNQTSSSSKHTRFSDRVGPIRPRALKLPLPPSTVHSSQSAPTVKDDDEPSDDDDEGRNGGQSSTPATVDEILAAADRTRLWLAIAYGATSGTLSGLCLLFTKTGLDLVIQTLVHRNNQFGHFGAWALLIVLLVCELAQLSYLNRALRLVGPTLVCPTAFCFYNATSILSGLIYYRQFDALRPMQGVLIALGSAVLLGGVWIVSVKPAAPPAETEGISESRRDKVGSVGSRREDDYADAGSGLSMDEMMGDEEDFFDSEEDDDDEDLIPYRPRGFSIGISAASPGFEIRPSAAPRRSRLSLDGTTIPERNELLLPLDRSTRSLPPPPPSSSSSVDQSHTSPLNMTSELRDSSFKKSPPCAEEADGAQQPLHHRRSRRTVHHHHRRHDSLTGSPYVGPPPPPHSYVINLSTDRTPSPTHGADDDGLGAAPEGQFARDGARRWWWWQRWFRSQPAAP